MMVIMQFEPPLQKAILIKRYKRFLVDVVQNKKQFTIHCANTGAMTGCAEPGSIAWYSVSDNPNRKYPGTLEIVQNPWGYLIGVNTHRANALVAEALQHNIFPGLDHTSFKREVTVGESRLDFLLETAAGDHYLEVKSVTLGPMFENTESNNMADKAAQKGYFPDAKSTRAIKHLHSLSELVSRGNKATLVFCVQHSGISEVHPATHIHPEYTSELIKASINGVNIRAFKAEIICHENRQSIELKKEIPVILPK